MVFSPCWPPKTWSSNWRSANSLTTAPATSDTQSRTKRWPPTKIMLMLSKISLLRSMLRGTVNVYRQYILWFTNVCITWAHRTVGFLDASIPASDIWLGPPMHCVWQRLFSGHWSGSEAAQQRRHKCPTAYHSRKLVKYKKNYAVTKFEWLTTIYAVEEWQCYLHRHPFTVVMNHSAFQWIETMKNPSGRLFQWSLKLSMCDAIRKYQGCAHIEAGTLSQLPTVELLTLRELRRAFCGLTQLAACIRKWDFHHQKM